jgi:hypothetical protein
MLLRSAPLSNDIYLMVTLPMLLATAKWLTLLLYAKALDCLSAGSSLVVLAPPITFLAGYLLSSALVSGITNPF